MLRLKFSCYHDNEGSSQNCQKSLFCVDFFHQNWFQNATTSQWIEKESNAFQRWLHVTLWSILWSFLASGKSKIFFSPPFKYPKQKVAHSLMATPWCIFWLGLCLFLINISQTKTCVLGPNRTFFTIWGLKEGGGVESALFRVNMS
jgi:hypothetical protein